MALPEVDRFVALGEVFVFHRFAKAGDEIPLHTHAFSHVSICCKGRLEAFDSKGKSILLKECERIVFAPGQEHGLRALDDDTLMLNANDSD